MLRSDFVDHGRTDRTRSRTMMDRAPLLAVIPLARLPPKPEFRLRALESCSSSRPAFHHRSRDPARSVLGPEFPSDRCLTTAATSCPMPFKCSGDGCGCWENRADIGPTRFHGTRSKKKVRIDVRNLRIATFVFSWTSNQAGRELGGNTTQPRRAFFGKGSRLPSWCRRSAE